MNKPGAAADSRKQPDLIVLVGLVILALSLLTFLLLAGAVTLGGTQAVDDQILKTIRHWAIKDPASGRIWAEESVIAITSLGTLVILVTLTCVVIGLLLLTGRRQVSLYLFVAMLGAIGLNYALKALFARDRPTVVPRLQRVDSKSFPSGHALVSTAVYTALGAVGGSLLNKRRLKVYVIGIAAALSIAIGFSRVYLGVHYPSDVIAGWSIGFSWALLCWLGAHYLQSRGILEKPR